jgi:hypothetical protein
VKQTFYLDSDGDTYGDAGTSTEACTAPPNYVSNADDCDDTDGNVYPGATEVCNGIDDNCDDVVDEGVKQTFYLDSDDDGYGDAANSTEACTAPPNYVSNADDCDDGDASAYPGAPEICDDGKDNDCDTQTDENCELYYWDGDSDGYGNPAGPTSTFPQSGYVDNNDDCDDGNDDIHPGATEQCNEVDDDCDGNTDEGCVTYCEDADGDGYGNPSFTTTVNSPAPPPGYEANCGDCNDDESSIHPGATEVLDDGIDNNCDGLVDEGVCATECSPCDLNNDGVCDDVDLVIFGLEHGWGNWDCHDNPPGTPCLCDIVPDGVCNSLDGVCFLRAWNRPECKISLYIEKLRPRKAEPGKAIRIIGRGFGDGAAGDFIYFGPKKLEFGSPRIKLWTDTKIRVKIPKYKYIKNDNAWFNGEDFRRVRVRVRVGGEDSNYKRLKILNPAR